MKGRWNNPEHVTLPVKLIDGHWELLYGGSTGVRDGAYGELRVSMSCIEDEEIRRRLAQTVTVKVFDEDAELLVALRDRDCERNVINKPAIDPEDMPLGCTRFERISIGPKTRSTERITPDCGGLWVRQRGVDRTELVCSSVRMPEGFEPGAAASLNHACTLLSEQYEQHRISHTLNVYQHVFYLEPGHPQPRWHPLERLRNGVIAGVERSIVADAWHKLETQLGFRPIGKIEARQQRRDR